MMSIFWVGRHHLRIITGDEMERIINIYNGILRQNRASMRISRRYCCQPSPYLWDLGPANRTKIDNKNILRRPNCKNVRRALCIVIIVCPWSPFWQYNPSIHVWSPSLYCKRFWKRFINGKNSENVNYMHIPETETKTVSNKIKQKINKKTNKIKKKQVKKYPTLRAIKIPGF